MVHGGPVLECSKNILRNIKLMSKLILISASIPEKLTRIYSGNITVHRQWDDIEVSSGQTPNDREVVTPAFICSATSDNAKKTGRRWAEQYTRSWKGSEFRYDDTSKVEIKEDEIDNEPFEGLRLVSLEIRNQGGRAWKVIDGQGFYYDLREDVLLDTLKTDGCAPDGILCGTYIWGRINSQYKLVRVGSELHNAIRASTTRKESEILPQTGLVVGGIYEDKRCDRSVFLGYVSVRDRLGTIKKYKSMQVWTRVFRNATTEAGLEIHRTYWLKLLPKHTMIKLTDSRIQLSPDIIEKCRASFENDALANFGPGNANPPSHYSTYYNKYPYSPPVLSGEGLTKVIQGMSMVPEGEIPILLDLDQKGIRYIETPATPKKKKVATPPLATV